MPKKSKDKTSEINFDSILELVLLLQDELDSMRAALNKHLKTQNEVSTESRLKLQYSKWEHSIEETQGIFANLHRFLNITKDLLLSYYDKLKDIEKKINKDSPEHIEKFKQFNHSLSLAIKPFLNKAITPLAKFDEKDLIGNSKRCSSASEFFKQLQDSESKLVIFKQEMMELEKVWQIM
jgi:hypothetical protein